MWGSCKSSNCDLKASYGLKDSKKLVYCYIHKDLSIHVCPFVNVCLKCGQGYQKKHTCRKIDFRED